MSIFKKKKSNGIKKYYLFGIKIFERKQKHKLSGNLTDNNINLPNSGKFNIQIYGKNNEVYINPENKNSFLSLVIYGNNNKIIIDSVEPVFLKGTIGDGTTQANNTLFHIGENSSVNKMFFILMDDGSSIKIGQNCMISCDVEMWASDTHSIFDESGTLINLGKEIIIGDSVWIGKDVKILKNTAIPNGCIVGMGSTVSKKFTIPNSIIAGIPAKVVKENISWSQQRPNEFLNKTHQ